MMFGVDGTDTAYAAPEAATITSIYDKTGRPIERDRKTFAYNDHGDVIRKSRSRLTRNTVLEKECLHQNRIALARIGRKHSFAINMIRTVIGSKRSLKLLADRYGVLSVERSV